MQQEIRFATFNVCNLAPPGAKLYDNLAPLTPDEYQAKVQWTARQLDLLDADVIGLQEIFSMSALRDVLAASRHYRDATLAGFDPVPEPLPSPLSAASSSTSSSSSPSSALLSTPAQRTGKLSLAEQLTKDLPLLTPRLTPQVALVSRLPLAAPATAYSLFPDGVALPAGSRDADRFARAPLHAQVVLGAGRVVDVLVVHLKSKRPDYRNGDSGDDPMLYAQANLRSLIRRGTEAVALRGLVSQLARQRRRPCIVMGDFNDTADAVTTSIVLGAGAACMSGQELSGRLFDCNQIQLRQDRLRHVGYTNVHDGHYMTIDHVLVSEEFNPASRYAIGEVLDVSYLNDHLLQPRPEASDHGQVLVRLRLYGPREPAAPR